MSRALVPERMPFVEFIQIPEFFRSLFNRAVTAQD
jgi:hypothetical protein